MYTHLLSKCSKNAVLELQEMVHAIWFLKPNRNMIGLKFVKSDIFLAVLREHIFSISSELRFIKRATLFERNCIAKCVIFFTNLLTLRLSAARKS